MSLVRQLGSGFPGTPHSYAAGKFKFHIWSMIMKPLVSIYTRLPIMIAVIRLNR